MAAPKNESPIIVAFTLDFETGGLKCQTSACTQIAIHATRLDTFERLGTFVKYIYPYNRQEVKGVGTKRKVLKTKYEQDDTIPMDYEQKALEYSAITMDMLETMGEDIKDVARGALDFIIEHTPKTPKNLMQMMEYAGLVKELSKYLRGHEDFYGHWEPLTLDTILLGQLALCHLPNVDSYKLEIMCEHLGIELDDAHDADADVSATTNVVAVVTQRMRSIGGEIVNPLAISKTEKSRKHFKI